MARAMFTVPAGAAAGGPAPGTLTAGVSAPTASNPADDGGKRTQTQCQNAAEYHPI